MSSSADVGSPCRLCGTEIADCGVCHDGLCCGCEDRRAMKWPTVAQEHDAMLKVKALYAQFDRERERQQ